MIVVLVAMVVARKFLHGTHIVLRGAVNGDTAGNTVRVSNELAEGVVAAVEDLRELHAVQRRNG